MFWHWNTSRFIQKVLTRQSIALDKDSETEGILQSFDAYGQMLEHLKLFFVTMLFAPPVWIMLVPVYFAGLVIGRGLRHIGYGNIFVLLYLAGFFLSFVFRSAGWDLMILAGLPFMLGVYIGKKRK